VIFLYTGSSLKFVTTVFKSYLREQQLDHLVTMLKKSGVGNRFLDFFPQNKRTIEFLTAHFTEHGLQSLVEIHLGNLQKNMKDVTKATLTDMFKQDKTVEEVVTYANGELKSNEWNESDIMRKFSKFLISSDSVGIIPREYRMGSKGRSDRSADYQGIECMCLCVFYALDLDSCLHPLLHLTKD
jgi:hypothetical protein